MNTLFKSKVSRKSVQPNSEERIPKTIEIKSISHGWPTLLFRIILKRYLKSSQQCCAVILYDCMRPKDILIDLFLFCLDIEEKGVRMKLTVIDTPGFGDQINNENW